MANQAEIPSMEPAQAPAMETFFKYRGVGKCLSEGISFLTDRFFRFLLLTLPVALPFAVVLAVMIYMGCDARLLAQPGQLLFMQAILAFLTVIFESVFAAVIYRLVICRAADREPRHLRFSDLYDKELAPLSLRVFGVIVLSWLISMLFVAAMGALLLAPIDDEGLITLPMKVVGLLVLLLAMVAVCVPTLICLPSVMLGEGKFLHRVLIGYRYGWKKWGRVFSLSLLMTLIVFVVVMLSLSPAIVISMLKRVATQSILEGDVVALPTMFPLWASLIFVVSSYIYTIIYWLQIVPYSFLYAAIRTDIEEEEKSKLPMV